MADIITYKVVIRGHEPPFKWSVHYKKSDDDTWKAAQVMDIEVKADKGATSYEEKLMPARGTADSFDECMQEAREAAEQAEWNRQHVAARYEEEILSVEPIEIPGISL